MSKQVNYQRLNELHAKRVNHYRGSNETSRLTSNREESLVQRELDLRRQHQACGGGFRVIRKPID